MSLSLEEIVWEEGFFVVPSQRFRLNFREGPMDEFSVHCSAGILLCVDLLRAHILSKTGEWYDWRKDIQNQGTGFTVWEDFVQWKLGADR